MRTVCIIPYSLCVKESHSESENLCNWPSVSHSVRFGIGPLWVSWPDFSCGQDKCFSFVMGRSVCRNWISNFGPYLKGNTSHLRWNYHIFNI